MKNEELDKSDFEEWQRHPITILIMGIFTENKEILKEEILSLDAINDKLLTRKLAYLQGALEINTKLLDMSFEQLLNKEEEEKEDAKTPYSW